jgi:hypothetical protein
LLCSPQFDVFFSPAPKGRQPEPALDDPVYVIEQEHFGQHQLTLEPSVELADCIVPETQQF